MPTQPVAAQIVELFRARGASEYGGERVTQEQHGLQAALAAEREGSEPALVVAALLHDVGHLLHDLPDDAPDQGIDDHHENSGQRWLARHFPPEVTEPVRLHVDAKRYLCATDPSYEQTLSPPSIHSLRLQGGAMSLEEIAAFEALPHWREAVRLRRWDDAAKVADLITPPLAHFLPYIERAARPEPQVH